MAMTMAQLRATPEGKALEQALTDLDREKQKPEAERDAAKMAAIQQAVIEAHKDFTELQKRYAAEEAVDAAEGVRREWIERGEHDLNRGKAHFDAPSGKLHMPTARRFGKRLELVGLVPEGTADDPMTPYLHLPADDRTEEGKFCHDLQDVCDQVLVCSKMLHRHPSQTRYGKTALDVMLTKAAMLSPTVSGLGSQWVPTVLSAQAIEDVYLAADLLNAVTRFPMTSSAMDIPALLTRPQAYRNAVATDSDQFGQPSGQTTTITTGKVSYSAEMVKVLLPYAAELIEDAVFAVGPQMLQDSIDALAYGMEDALINGSTLLTDIDNAGANKLWTASNDIRNSWDGYRKMANASGAEHNAGGTGAFALTDLLAAKRMMGKYGVGGAEANLRWVVGPDAESMFLGLTEVKTLEVFGPQATVVTGEIGRILGIPVILSGNVYGPYQGTGLNASGVYDGVTTTATIAQLINLSAAWLGDRRTVTVDTDQSKIGGLEYLIVSWRGDFQKRLPAASKTEVTIYNMVP